MGCAHRPSVNSCVFSCVALLREFALRRSKKERKMGERYEENINELSYLNEISLTLHTTKKTNKKETTTPITSSHLTFFFFAWHPHAYSFFLSTLISPQAVPKLHVPQSALRGLCVAYARRVHRTTPSCSDPDFTTQQPKEKYQQQQQQQPPPPNFLPPPPPQLLQARRVRCVS